MQFFNGHIDGAGLAKALHPKGAAHINRLLLKHMLFKLAAGTVALISVGVYYVLKGLGYGG